MRVIYTSKGISGSWFRASAMTPMSKQSFNDFKTIVHLVGFCTHWYQKECR
jgi:hypothetical protein